MSNELVKSDGGALSPVGIVGINVEQLINKAIDAKSAVEVIKELREMAMDDQRIRAKQAFNVAMQAFQAECPVIVKTRTVRDNSNNEAYKFAPIEQIESVIRPVCQKHGFSHKFPKMELGEGRITVYCEVTHEAGHSETTCGTYRAGTKTKMMSDTQVDASAETFAKRRVLCSAYGLVLSGEDIDGADARREKPQGPSSMAAPKESLKALVTELWSVLRPVRGEEKNWNKANHWLWKYELLDAAAEEIAPQLSEKRLQEVIAKAGAKIKELGL